MSTNVETPLSESDELSAKDKFFAGTDNKKCSLRVPK
jgi:hypothetical protein